MTLSGLCPCTESQLRPHAAHWDDAATGLSKDEPHAPLLWGFGKVHCSASTAVDIGTSWRAVANRSWSNDLHFPP